MKSRKLFLTGGTMTEPTQPSSGTIVTLSGFLPKRVPTRNTFYRQLARVFRNIPQFDIKIQDTNDSSHQPEMLPPFQIPIDETTKIDIADRPVPFDNGHLPVSGWIAKAKKSYQNDEEAGIRIYVRNKLAETTRDFRLRSGYSGEFVARSYVVGEVVADWLDLDDKDDLIATDRQGILWNTDYGRALEHYGQQLMKEVARKTVTARQKSAKERFLQATRIKERAFDRYGEDNLVDTGRQPSGAHWFSYL